MWEATSTPPSTSNTCEQEASDTLKASRAACSPPGTPRSPGVGKVRSVTTPPRQIRCTLLAAIRSGSSEQVRQAIADDDTSVHVPLCTVDGCEAPVVLAIREGCSVGILDLLLRSGASANETNSAGLTVLEMLCAAPEVKLAEDATMWGQTSACSLDFVMTLPETQEPRLPSPPAAHLAPPPPIAAACSLVTLCMAAAGTGGAGPLLPCAAGGDEARRCALAARLLAHGAHGRDAAAQAAEQHGHILLAGLLRHCRDYRVCCWLRRLWTRRAALVSTHGLGLLHCPRDVCELIVEFLVLQEVALALSLNSKGNG